MILQRIPSLIPMAFFALALSCSNPQKAQNNSTTKQKKDSMSTDDSTAKWDTATFGAGCFWCVEAIFLEVEGVKSVRSGYTGGSVKNPTYKEICTGNTGHAEVTRIVYDPAVTSFKELLEVFWEIHDPTSLNKQGNDVGTQYRSAVFYHTTQQKEEAEFYKNKLNEEKAYAKPVVTEIVPVGEFYKAEDYHQDYYTNNADQTYCVYVIRPKIDKFRKAFKHKLKK
jgi:peptide-methionine (S)-S-oxide reductase